MRKEQLEVLIEEELGDNGRILLSVPKYRRGGDGEFIYEPVSLNIVVNDLPKGIEQIVRVLKSVGLMSKSSLKFNSDDNNLFDLDNIR